MKNVAVALLILACSVWPHAVTAQSKERAKLPASTEIDRANTGAIEKIGFVEKPVVLWKQNLGGDASFGGVAVFHGVIVGCDSGLVALDRETGRWNSASASITDRYVVFGSNDGKVYAVVRGMGSPAWEYDVTEGGKVHGSMIYSRPLAADGMVYIPVMSSGTIHAIDLETGKAKWKLTPLPGADIDSDLHFADGRMFLSTRMKSRQVGADELPQGEAAIIAIGNRVEKRGRAE